MRKLTLSVALFGLFLLGACSANNSLDTQENNAQSMPNGDIREETQVYTELPTFLDEHDENMHNLYTAVAMHQGLLEQIPCYCGCGNFGHKDNYDCFINENKENGAIVWDNHATKCQACLDIAAESIVKYNDGESVKDIRTYIDQKYEEYEPTPTPEV